MARLASWLSSASGRLQPTREAFLGSDTGKAAGLAGASLANNAIALVFTVAITRMLGSDDYGALAALVSAFLILYVVGQSIQAAAARETALASLGDAAALRRTVEGWERTLLGAAVVLIAAGILLRSPLAAVCGTQEHEWGAAALPVTGASWMLVCLQRGVLQGLHSFRPVAVSIVWEAVARLVLGVSLGAAAGVSGAFIATPLAFGAVSLGMALTLRGRLAPGDSVTAARTLRSLISKGWLPVVGLILLAVLQNVDVIIARHRLGHDKAGSYAVAAVAAKTVVWVAIGVGLQLLPQATTRAARGIDPRPVLWRALGILAVVAGPALLLFAVVPKLLLRVAFGEDTQDAAPALIFLGLAMTFLAVSYLTVQFLIALGEVRFLGLLALAVTAEIVLLVTGDYTLIGFAHLVAAVQCVVAVGALLLALRASARAAPG